MSGLQFAVPDEAALECPFRRIGRTVTLELVVHASEEPG